MNGERDFFYSSFCLEDFMSRIPIFGVFGRDCDCQLSMKDSYG